MTDIISSGLIERRIHQLRGRRVMLDSDLAALYGVTTGNLNLNVRRNQKRFPPDFMFQLTQDEVESLLLQSAISKGRGGRRTPPYAFTQEGVAMLSGVLGSDLAIQVNIGIMRAFVRVREVLAANADLAKRLDELEQKHDAMAQTTDQNFREVVEAIRKLMTEPLSSKPIGFRPTEPGEPRPRSKRAKRDG